MDQFVTQTVADSGDGSVKLLIAYGRDRGLLDGNSGNLCWPSGASVGAVTCPVKERGLQDTEQKT